MRAPSLLFCLVVFLALAVGSQAEFTSNTHYFSNFTIDNNLTRSSGVSVGSYGLISTPSLVASSNLGYNAQTTSWGSPSWAAPGLNCSGTGAGWSAVCQVWFDGDILSKWTLGDGTYETAVSLPEKRWVNSLSVVLDGDCSSRESSILFKNSTGKYQNVSSLNDTTVLFNVTAGKPRIDWLFTPVFSDELFFSASGAPSSPSGCEIWEVYWRQANFSSTTGVYYSNVINAPSALTSVNLTANQVVYNGTGVLYNLSCDGTPDRLSNVTPGVATACSGNKLLVKIVLNNDGSTFTPIITNFSLDFTTSSINTSVPSIINPALIYVGGVVNVSTTLLDSGSSTNATVYFSLVKNSSGRTYNITTVYNVTNGSVVSLNLSMNESGFYYVAVYSNDSGTVSVIVDSPEFEVNNSLPSVALTSPNVQNVTNATPVRFAWVGSDNDTIDTLAYNLIWNGVRNVTGLTDSNFTLTSLGVLNGTYNWSVEVTDGVMTGFINSTPRNLTIDNTIPEITDVVNTTTSGSITVDFTVNKTSRGVISYGTDPTLLTSVYPADGIGTYQPAGLQGLTISPLNSITTYYYVLTVFDPYGNQANTSIIIASTNSGGGGGGGGGGTYTPPSNTSSNTSLNGTTNGTTLGGVTYGWSIPGTTSLSGLIDGNGAGLAGGLVLLALAFAAGWWILFALFKRKKKDEEP